MKLRLPNKLIAAIVAAATPALFSTLSTATLGAAAVATLSQQAVADTVWDANWGIESTPEIPDGNVVTNFPAGTTYLQKDGGPSYIVDGFGAVVQLGGTASGVTANVFGGKRNASDAKPTWMYVTGGQYGLVGGTVFNNWGGSDPAAVDFTGDTHLLIQKGESALSVDTVIGGLHQDDDRAPTFRGNSYISIYSDSVTGGIIGGNTAYHNNGTNFTGNTNIYIYEALSTASSSVEHMPAAVIGGNVAGWNESGKTLALTGKSHITLDLSEATGASFAKKIVGASWGNYASILKHGAAYINITHANTVTFTDAVIGDSYIGNSNVVSNTTETHVTIGSGTFNEYVIGASYIGSTANNSNVSTGTSSLTIQGGTFKKAIAGGAYLSSALNGAVTVGVDNTALSISAGSFNGMVFGGSYDESNKTNNSVTINEKALTTISGGQFSEKVIGGSYLHTESRRALSAASVEMNLSGGTYSQRVIGGHFVNGTGSASVAGVSVGDISMNITGGTYNSYIIGGTLLYRSSSDVMSQGNISVTLGGNAVINKNVFAAGEQQRDSRMLTESTKVSIGNGVRFGNGVTVSGGYGYGSNNAGPALIGATSTITGSSTLAFTDAAYDNLGNVTFTQFNRIEVADGGSVALTAGQLSQMNTFEKAGAGALQLSGNLGDINVSVAAGSLTLTDDATYSINGTLSNSGTLDMRGTLTVGANTGENFELFERAQSDFSGTGAHAGNGFLRGNTSKYYLVKGSAGSASTTDFSQMTGANVVEGAGSAGDVIVTLDTSSASDTRYWVFDNLTYDDAQMASATEVYLHDGSSLTAAGTVSTPAKTLLGGGLYIINGVSKPNNIAFSATDWTGTVRIGNNFGATATDFQNQLNDLGGRVEISGIQAWLGGNVTTAHLILTGTGENGTGEAFRIVNGSSGVNREFTGTVSGKGDFNYQWDGGTDNGSSTQTHTFKGDVSGWTGTFRAKNTGGQLVGLQFSDAATTVNANVEQDGDRKLTVTFTNTGEVEMNGRITKNEGKANLTVVSAATNVNFNGAITADNLITNSGKKSTINSTATFSTVEGAGTLHVAETGTLNLTGASTIHNTLAGNGTINLNAATAAVTLGNISVYTGSLNLTTAGAQITANSNFALNAATHVSLAEGTIADLTAKDPADGNTILNYIKNQTFTGAGTVKFAGDDNNKGGNYEILIGNNTQNGATLTANFDFAKNIQINGNGKTDGKQILTIADGASLSLGQDLRLGNHGTVNLLSGSTLTVGRRLYLGHADNAVSFPGLLTISGGDAVLNQLNIWGGPSENNKLTMTSGSLEFTGEGNAIVSTNQNVVPTGTFGVITLSGGTLKAQSASWALSHNATIGSVTVETSNDKAITLGYVAKNDSDEVTYATTTTLSGTITNNGTLNLTGIMNVTSAATVNALYGVSADDLSATNNGYKYSYDSYQILSADSTAGAVVSDVTWKLNGTAAENLSFDGKVLSSAITSSGTDKYYINTADTVSLTQDDTATQILYRGTTATGSTHLTVTGKGSAESPIELKRVDNNDDNGGYNGTAVLNLTLSGGSVLMLNSSSGSSSVVNGDIAVNAGSTLILNDTDMLGWSGGNPTKTLVLTGEEDSPATVLLKQRQTTTPNITLNGHTLIGETSDAVSSGNDLAGIETYDCSITAIGTDNTINTRLMLNHALTVDVQGADSTLEIGGRVYTRSGSGNKLTKTGTGTLTFSYTPANDNDKNTFNKGIDVNGGVVNFENKVGLGDNSSIAEGAKVYFHGGSITNGKTLTNNGVMVLDGSAGNVDFLKRATGTGSAVITGDLSVGNSVTLGLTGNLTVTNGANLALSNAKGSPTKLGWTDEDVAKGFSSVTLAGGIISSNSTLGIVRDLTVQADTEGNKISFLDFPDEYAANPTTFSDTTTLNSDLEIFTEYKSQLQFDHITGSGALTFTVRHDRNNHEGAIVNIDSLSGFSGNLTLTGNHAGEKAHITAATGDEAVTMGDLSMTHGDLSLTAAANVSMRSVTIGTASSALTFTGSGSVTASALTMTAGTLHRNGTGNVTATLAAGQTSLGGTLQNSTAGVLKLVIDHDAELTGSYDLGSQIDRTYGADRSGRTEFNVSETATFTISGTGSGSAFLDKSGAGKLVINSGSVANALYRANGGMLTLKSAATENDPTQVGAIYLNGGNATLDGGHFVIGGSDNTKGLFIGSTGGQLSLINRTNATVDMYTNSGEDWRFQIIGGNNKGVRVEKGSTFKVNTNHGETLSVRTLGDEDATITASATTNYNIDKSVVEIANAGVTFTKATEATLNNKLTNSTITNNGAGGLTITNNANTLVGVTAQGGSITVEDAESSAATLESIRAEGGNVTIQGLSEAVVANLNELYIASGKTVSAYQANTVPTAPATDNEANISVSGTLTAGNGATLNANLTMQGGSTIDVDYANGGLTMGSTVTFAGGDKMHLSTDIINGLNSLTIGEGLTLFSGVDAFTINGGAYDVNTTYTASDYFNLAGVTTASDFVIKYGNGGIAALSDGTDQSGQSIFIYREMPEPATATLSLLALAALAARRKRK